jgi:hypothetical protein
LFAFPGPAALGFVLMLPAVVFSEGHRLEILLVVSLYYLLPLVGCTLLIYFGWWLTHRRGIKRGSL